jgi:hypothetical protein
MLYCCPIALVLSVALRHSSHGNISMMPADELVCRGIPARCVTAHARHDASASRAIQSARALFVFPCPSPRRGERGRTPFSRDELTNRSLPSRPVWPPSPSRPVPSLPVWPPSPSCPATASQVVPTESGHATSAACGTAPTARLQSIPSIPRARAFVTASSSSGP